MRLYVVCHNPACKSRIYLQSTASSHSELPAFFSIKCSNQNCNLESQYRREEVRAEARTGSGVGGAVAGGLVGLLGGPIGLIIGAIIGGTAGASADQAEEEKVNRFNEEVGFYG